MHGTLSYNLCTCSHDWLLCGEGDVKDRNIVRLGSGEHALIDFGETDAQLMQSLH